MKGIRTVEFREDAIYLLDQTKLPLNEEYIVTDDYERIALSIERLEVRGAPAIGVAAAYALALAVKNVKGDEASQVFRTAYKRIALTRPTAVNLFYAIDEMKDLFEQNPDDPDLYSKLIKKAIAIHLEDISLCGAIAANGINVFKKKSRVLTHCNAGALATGGGGTAVNIIRNAFEKGLVEYVYVDETRPLLQGSRLTAWELSQYGIPFSINTDSAAAFLMKLGKVDLVLVGADRIAANGDTANKIGTYNLAVLCNYHKIPFYIAAPFTTIDSGCSDGSKIKIEERNKKELTRFFDRQITSDEYNAFCPAFDVTPYELITGIITEKKVFEPPFSFSHV
jgi:methylthioribose-1-phosphate isomerase